jgi:alkylation response protein AidB-like acyl-CoA dehydrogenase
LIMESIESFRARAKAWLAENAAPVDRTLPYTESADRALQANLAAGGFAGITLPVEYGGQGLTFQHQKVFYEEARDYDLPTGFVVSLAMLAPTLVDHASPDFLHEHLPRMLAGEEMWIQLLSEPAGGSDLAGAITSATRDGDAWVLNGSKIWSTGAATADFGMCLARTDWDAPKHSGLTMFALPLRAPGVTITPIRKSDGTDEFCQEFFDDVIIPTNSVIGEVHGGWAVAQTLLLHERNSTGGVGHAIGIHPQGESVTGVQDLFALAGPRRQSPTTRQLLAEAYMNAVVQEYASARIMSGYRSGKLSGPWGSLLKLSAAVRDYRRGEIALIVSGSDGVAWSDIDDVNGPIGSQWLTAKVLSIAGGTNEMQRNIISERLLNLPREVAADRGVPFREVHKRRGT